MSTSISYSELIDHMAYYQLDPWGEERADARAGIIASTIYNVNRGKGKALTYKDFMLRFADSPIQQQSWKQQLSIIETLNKVFHGKDERKK